MLFQCSSKYLTVITSNTSKSNQLQITGNANSVFKQISNCDQAVTNPNQNQLQVNLKCKFSVQANTKLCSSSNKSKSFASKLENVNFLHVSSAN